MDPGSGCSRLVNHQPALAFSQRPVVGTPGRNLQGPERVPRSEALLSAVIALCRAGCGRTLSSLWIAGSSNFPEDVKLDEEHIHPGINSTSHENYSYSIPSHDTGRNKKGTSVGSMNPHETKTK